MSAIILSDLHSHAWPRFATTLPDGTNSRFQNLLDVLAQVELYVDEFNVTDLLMLGDLTHRRYYVQFSVYSRICEWLCRMKERDVRVIALVGNHDIESEGHHSLEPLVYMNIDVVDKPEWLSLRDSGPCFFMPYMQRDIVKAAQDALRMDGADDQALAFLHYAFDGKILDNEFAVPTALKKSDMDGFSKIILGHVHSPGIEDDGRVVYVGAPLHFDFGDHGDRFCWLLHGSTLRALPLRFPKFVTTSYPRVPSPPLEMSGFLRVLGVPRNLFGDIKKSALEQGWTDTLLVEQQIPTEAIRALSSNVMVSEDMVREYVTTQYPDASEQTRQEIAELGLRFLREAQQ